MHPAVLAQRNAVATQRMVTAVTTLAERMEIPVPNLRHGHVHDPQAAALFQRESIADFLELLIAQTAEASAESTPSSDDRTVAELVPAIAGMDTEALAEIETAEQSGKGRSTVLQAIAKRRDALLAEADAADLSQQPSGELQPV